MPSDDSDDLLRSALEGADSWFSIYSRLLELISEGDELNHRALVWAFGYMLIGPSDTEHRQREGSPFGALFEFESGRLPPRLEEVPEDEVVRWREAYDAVDDPRARSRLGDLLWCRRSLPRPDLAGRTAARALLALAGDPSWNAMERTDGLVRALEIARELSDKELEGDAVTHVVAAIRGELETTDERPGISYSLLRALVELPASSRPSELPALLERSAEVYGADPHQLDVALELSALIASADERSALRERQVNLWRGAALEGDGILKQAFLERALDLARSHDLAELADELRRDLQAISDEDLDLKLVSSEVKVPTAELDAFVAQFVSFEDWKTSLTVFGDHGPPGGEPDEIQARVAKLRAAHPLQFLVTKTVLDPDRNLPIFHAVDDATHQKAAVAQQIVLASRVWGVLAVDILERFIATYDRPEPSGLTEFFTTPLIDGVTAASIAHAFELYFDGREDDAAHVLAPRLETVIRALALKLGLVIIREPIGDRPGQWRGVGELLRALEGRLPTEGWRLYLLSLLSDALGLNLRNVIAHGVRDRISRVDAALLLHTACFLRLLQVNPAEQ